MTPESLMRRAIKLSEKGFPAPNPHVGCVIERDGVVVGEGFHHHAGGNHAEVEALIKAGNKAEGATVYVTLEPCNHQGRTGPCSEALIKAKVRKVIYACSDPNPRAVGGGDRLRSAGVEIESGLLAQEARASNEQFFFSLEQGRPLITVKAAMTLDGRIALPSGESQWITDTAARRRGHWLRAQCGAVLVGIGTIKADNARLTARIPGVVNQPTRIVLDPNSELTGSEAVFSNEAPTIHLTRHDVAVVDGKFDLAALLKLLLSRNITGVLVEGGAHTIHLFVSAGLVDRLELFVAPKLMGAGLNWLEGPSLSTEIEALPKFEFTRLRRVGPDLWLSARPRV